MNTFWNEKKKKLNPRLVRTAQRRGERFHEWDMRGEDSGACSLRNPKLKKGE